MSRPADPHARIALLRAAEAVFAERGVASAKVEEIARRANVSKGAFYLHFQSKDDALRAIVEAFLARCSAILPVPAALDAMPADPSELLEYCCDVDVELFEFFWQNRAVLAILSGCQGPLLYLLDTFRHEVEQRTQAWIDVMKARGMFRDDLDSSLVSTLMCGAYHELVHRVVASPKRPPIREWIEKAQDAFVRGLGSPTYSAAAGARHHADNDMPAPHRHARVARGRA